VNSQLKIRILETSDLIEDMLKNRWSTINKFDSELADYVGSIVEEVKRRGDTALVDFAKRFDGAEMSANRLRVTNEDIKRAYDSANEEQIYAIEFAKNRVEAFQRELLRRINFEYKAEGVRVRSCTSPIQRVGCYIPGGQAAYPSTLVMTVVPAKVAGVPKIAICSPPGSGGEINPLTLVAADICGVDEIYRVGGAQAVAALAYGTETIKPVNKLVGPGNKYVLRAKMLVSRDLPTDIPAGPSELVVFADEVAEPRLVALDMISQAEHVDGVSILVTTSRDQAQNVANELERMVSFLPNKDMVVQNLSRHGSVLVCKNVEEAVKFINEFAPEHLEVVAEDAWNISKEITSAGLVLIGKYTPVSASDYCLGTIHVLPTKGFSRVYSGLSVLDFTRRFSVAECSREGLSRTRRVVKILGEGEGLTNHALAVEGRFEDA
jgi:histidinol dehydrogenase